MVFISVNEPVNGGFFSPPTCPALALFLSFPPFPLSFSNTQFGLQIEGVAMTAIHISRLVQSAHLFYFCRNCSKSVMIDNCRVCISLYSSSEYCEPIASVVLTNA